MLPRHLPVFQNDLLPGERRTELPLAWMCLLFLQVPHLLARYHPFKIPSLPANAWRWYLRRGRVERRGEPHLKIESGVSSSERIHQNCHLMLGLLSLSPTLVTSFPIKIMIPN